MRRILAMGAFLLLVLAAPRPVRADAFDLYFNPLLAQVPESKNAKAVKKLTPDMMVQHSRVLPNIIATFVVVKTNDGRMCKLLVQPAQQRVTATEAVPIVLIDRYLTFREGEERTIHAQGQNVRLFHDFRFSLDLGQVVPKELRADLRFVADKDEVYVEPVGRAELYLVTKHLPEATPRKGAKFVMGDKFEPRYLAGTFKLHDDGRRSGTLKLKVGDDGDVSGFYYSDKDGQKYDVSGKVGDPHHNVKFNITFPRTIQFFSGCMFTGDGSVITGTSRLQERETGFYAVRQEE